MSLQYRWCCHLIDYLFVCNVGRISLAILCEVSFRLAADRGWCLPSVWLRSTVECGVEDASGSRRQQRSAAHRHTATRQPTAIVRLTSRHPLHSSRPPLDSPPSICTLIVRAVNCRPLLTHLHSFPTPAAIDRSDRSACRRRRCLRSFVCSPLPSPPPPCPSSSPLPPSAASESPDSSRSRQIIESGTGNGRWTDGRTDRPCHNRAALISAPQRVLVVRCLLFLFLFCVGV